MIFDISRSNRIRGRYGAPPKRDDAGISEATPSKFPMARSAYFLFAAAVLVAGCTHQAPAAPQAPTGNRVTIHEDGVPTPAGTRIAWQINNEPPIIQVADGHGGPPILYHGHDINPDQLKSIRILKGKEARDRFGDQTLDAAIIMEFK